MGIQINGQTDTISAADGSFTIDGASGNLIGNLTGTASTATAAATAYGLSGSPNIAVGIITATTFSGSGSGLTGLTGVGKILQVVYAENGTSTSTTSSTYQDTNVTATITPTSASSKILIVLGLHLSTVSANAYASFLIKRGSTSIFTSGSETMYADTISQYRTTHGVTYLDSPSTTSATTYTIGVRSSFGTTTVEVNRGGKSTITLMEVAA